MILLVVATTYDSMTGITYLDSIQALLYLLNTPFLRAKLPDRATQSAVVLGPYSRGTYERSINTGILL